MTEKAVTYCTYILTKEIYIAYLPTQSPFPSELQCGIKPIHTEGLESQTGK